MGRETARAGGVGGVKKLRSIAISATLVAALYAGLFMGVNGALNVGLFIVWSAFVLSLFCLSTTMQKSMAEKERPFPGWFSVSVDIAALAMLAWSGYMLSSAAWLAAMILVHGARSAGEKMIKEEGEA